MVKTHKGQLWKHYNNDRKSRNDKQVGKIEITHEQFMNIFFLIHNMFCGSKVLFRYWLLHL